MTTDTVKNAKLTTESVVNFLFFETLTTEKSATVVHRKVSFGRNQLFWWLFSPPKGSLMATFHSFGRNCLTAEGFGCGRNSRNSFAVRPKTVSVDCPATSSPVADNHARSLPLERRRQRFPSAREADFGAAAAAGTNCIKIGLPGKLILSPILLKIVSENRFSGKTYFYTIAAAPRLESRGTRGGTNCQEPEEVQIGDAGQPVDAHEAAAEVFYQEKPGRSRFEPRHHQSTSFGCMVRTDTTMLVR